MPEPPRKKIDGDAVNQQVTSVAVAQRVGADMLPLRDRAQFLSTSHRRLHPSPGGRIERQSLYLTSSSLLVAV